MAISHRSQLNDHWFDPRSVEKKKSQPDLVGCTKCGCQWMELVEVYQYPKYHQVLLGQKPPTQSGPFYLFRCPKCGEVIEPSVQNGMRTAIRAEYDEFIERMTQDAVTTHSTEMEAENL